MTALDSNKVDQSWVLEILRIKVSKQIEVIMKTLIEPREPVSDSDTEKNMFMDQSIFPNEL